MSKYLTIILVMGIPALLFGNEARITRLKKNKVTKTATNNGSNSRRRENDILKKMYEQNKKINALLKRKSEVPYIWEGRSKILTGRVFKGTLLNSINSTNLSSPVLVKAHPEQGLDVGSKFACFGTTAHKRVQVICNKLVSNSGERRINALVLNMDGSSGLVGKYDDGKEDLITGAIISDFTQGVLSASKSRFVTSIGELEDASVKNKVFQGLINSGQTTSDILLEDMKNKEPVVTVEAGTQVLIYFQEGIDEI
jgi:hypothetical protein